MWKRALMCLSALVFIIGAFAGDVKVDPAKAQEAQRPLPEVSYADLPDRAAILPAMDCSDLPGKDFLSIKGAPSRVTSAELMTRDNGVAFCHVKGIIAPQIQFEFHLPVDSYTGRYLQAGCGGACGMIMNSVTPQCNNKTAFGGEFAVSFNNSGHVGPEGQDTLWAAYAPQLRIDYAHRAAHVMSLVAKEILATYYGQKPDYSYFIGCSYGGREAMMEAQRYPDDFDGVIAGAPALWINSGVVRIIYESQIAQDADGNQILTPESTRLLHDAVMAACDGLDGLKDGQIDNPRACKFDPRKLVCKPGQSEGCVTANQAEVMWKLYRGPVDDQGRNLYLGGEPYGSELLWSGPGSFTARGYLLAANQIKFMINGGETDQDFDWREWKPDRADLVELNQKGGFYNANNPDLSAFKARGGKLIMWQGEADNAGGSYILPHYYQLVRDKMGGFAATDPFMRVYLLPGVYHCAGGYIAYQHDMLGAMVNWVERGEAPYELIGSAILEDGTVRNRPVYPYPVQAKYKGTGDINAADSFVPVRPAAEPNDKFDWLGAGMIGGPPPAK